VVSNVSSLVNPVFLFTVHITLLDANNKKPEFTSLSYTANVYESLKVGEVITRVRATDGDTGVNARVYYSITLGKKEWSAVNKTLNSIGLICCQ